MLWDSKVRSLRCTQRAATDSRSDQPFTAPGQIDHPNLFERLASGSPLSGQPLDTRRKGSEYLQMRINRDETPDLFDNDIRSGFESFWERFQEPRARAADSHNLDEEVVRGAVEELLGFNGWAAAACSSLTRPFAAHKREESWDDLNSPDQLYYFALVVHGADHFLIDQLAVIVQLSKRLGPNSIFVSLVDYASSDSTPFLCDMAEAVMTLLGISFRILQIPPMTSDPTASYYPLEEAHTRNLALQPLHELYDRRQIKFTRVIWLKGFTCPNDILETLRVSFRNDASMVCSMDWKEHNGFFIYNDRWRTRDMDGNLFRGSKSTSPIDEAPPRDPYGGARYTLHLPFQVFCCESGAHIVDPQKSYYEGVTYQSSVAGVFNTSAAADGKTPKWSEGPCMDSSQLHFCRDMWMVAFRAGIKDEATRLMKKEKSGAIRKVHPFMEELIQAMQSSYAPTTNPLIGYPNSGDYLAEETGAGPGGGQPNEADAGIRGSGRIIVEQEEGPFEDDAEGTILESTERYDDDAGGDGRPIDLAVPIDDEYTPPVVAPAPIAVGGLDVVAGAAAAGAGAVIAGAPLNPEQWREVKVEAIPPAPAAKVPVKVKKPLLPVGQVADAKKLPAAAVVAGEKQALAKRNFLSSLFSSSALPPCPPSPATLSDDDEYESTNSRLEKRRSRSLPNSDFDYGVARIIVNPRCVTTYAGVSHTQLARDLFGSGEDKEPALDEGGKYLLDEWRTPPESFVCQEMRTTGGLFSLSPLLDRLLTARCARRSNRGETTTENRFPAVPPVAQRMETYLIRIPLAVIIISVAMLALCVDANWRDAMRYVISTLQPRSSPTASAAAPTSPPPPDLVSPSLLPNTRRPPCARRSLPLLPAFRPPSPSVTPTPGSLVDASPAQAAVDAITRETAIPAVVASNGQLRFVTRSQKCGGRSKDTHIRHAKVLHDSKYARRKRPDRNETSDPKRFRSINRRIESIVDVLPLDVVSLLRLVVRIRLGRRRLGRRRQRCIWQPER